MNNNKKLNATTKENWMKKRVSTMRKEISNQNKE